MNTDNKVVDLFLELVGHNTQSDYDNADTPSSPNQKVLADIVAKKLSDIGLQNVELTNQAYVYATLPSNVDKQTPTIGFIAHLDTSPDFSGENPKPQVISNYDGSDIILNKEGNIILSPTNFPEMLDYKGQDIICTDGTTLLGADDKAGVAEIITAMEYLIKHPEIKHGEIKVGFTPDEEIGRGADHFDVQHFAADFAFTIDGGQIGELEYENFNAAGAKIEIDGRIIHPGYAKDKMINSIIIGNKLLSMLPAHSRPEHTTGDEGFFHVMEFKGEVEKTTIQLIVRDHNADKFDKQKDLLKSIVNTINSEYPNSTKLTITEQYRNMREKFEGKEYIIDIAREAMLKSEVTPIIKAIRGGTDGARLSYMGLPCPNIFAGGHNFHGKFEYLPIQSMKKAVEVIVNIAEIATNK
ncbi:MAG: peptidase T [Bacteroidales bacterium]